MTIEESKQLIEPFFRCSEEEIYQLFSKECEGKKQVKISTKDPDHNSLYIPGDREDRVLLVAHVDTVQSHQNEKVEPIFHEGYYISKNRGHTVNKKGQPVLTGCGIGADDRAGVACLFHLMKQNLGHSILLVSGEEVGGKGSIQFMSKENRAEELQLHQFAIEFDRHNERDLVFYQCWTPEFIEYCQKSTGYRWNEGTASDICILCKEMCGVNISVGYDFEHTSYEKLNIEWLTNTINVVEKWLSNPLPKFIQN